METLYHDLTSLQYNFDIKMRIISCCTQAINTGHTVKLKYYPLNTICTWSLVTRFCYITLDTIYPTHRIKTTPTVSQQKLFHFIHSLLPKYYTTKRHSHWSSNKLFKTSSNFVADSLLKCICRKMNIAKSCVNITFIPPLMIPPSSKMLSTLDYSDLKLHLP